MERKLKMRVLIAKPGLGGHDRHAKKMAQGLKDEGFEVVFTGLRQTPGQIVDAAVTQQVDAVGLSLLGQGQADLVVQVMALLKKEGLPNVVLFGGGSLREEDIPALRSAGLEAVFPDGAPIADVADFLRRRCALAGTV